MGFCHCYNWKIVFPFVSVTLTSSCLTPFVWVSASQSSGRFHASKSHEAANVLVVIQSCRWCGCSLLFSALGLFIYKDCPKHEILVSLFSPLHLPLSPSPFCFSCSSLHTHRSIHPSRKCFQK